MKAEPRPMSSLMLQLLSGSHIPATEAKPEHTKQTSRQKEVQNKAGEATGNAKLTKLLFILRENLIYIHSNDCI